MDQVQAPNSPNDVTRRLWVNTGWTAFGIFLFYVAYVGVLDGGYRPSSFAKMMAGVSNMLFAMSLSLASLGYFFDFLDSKVVYRKYLGLMGYYFALIYSVALMIVRPERYFFGFFENLGTSDFILGLSSMALFSFVALISNDRAMQWIGPKRWRSFLRLSFWAYFLLVIRGAMNEMNPIGADANPEMWGAYLMNPHGPPPPRLLFSFIALAVIFLRLAMSFDQWRKKKQAVSTTPPLPSQGMPPAAA